MLGIATYLVILHLYTKLIDQRHQQEILFEQLQNAHAELQQAHKQLEISAQQQQELAVLRERAHIAREMHDTLGHALVLTSMKLEIIKQFIARDTNRAESEVDATLIIVRTAMQDLRNTLGEMHKSTHTSEIMLYALEQQIIEMRKHSQIEITYQIDPAIMSLPLHVYMELLRVCTEALVNIERHAHATQVAVALGIHQNNIELRVADNGCGLPLLPINHHGQATSPIGHYGLAGMHERISALNGTLNIVSYAGQGTTIVADVPVSDNITAVPVLVQ